jgi:ribosomal protein S18 acetylase RimI-like enzyme
LTQKPIDHRVAADADAGAIAGLATLVFLDTYAPQGIRPDLAREAFASCSTAAFAARIAESQTTFLLVESGEYLLGFAEVTSGRRCPITGVSFALEVVRLYVHPKFHGRGLGKELLSRAERHARSMGSEGVWLTVWSENAAALAFYERLGYKVVGTHEHVFEGRGYKNHVMATATPT